MARSPAALTFGAGTGDKVSVPAAASINTVISGVALWVRLTTLTSGRALIAKNSSLVAGGWRLLLSGTTGNLQVRVVCAGGASNYITSNTPLATLGALTFVAATWSPTVARIYSGSLATPVIEATYSTSTAGSGTANDDSAEPLLIGNFGSLAAAFQGDIMAVALFNIVPTLDDFRQLQFPMLEWDPTARVKGRGLVGAYALGAGGALAQLDLSGNKNDGTITGATLGRGIVPRRRGQIIYAPPLSGGTTPVSATSGAPYEAAARISQTLVSPEESRQAIVQTRLSPFEWAQRAATTSLAPEESLARIAALFAAPEESTARIAAQLASPEESAGRVAQALASPEESTARVALAAASPDENTQRAATSIASPDENAARAASSNAAPWESSGLLAVSNSQVSPWESLGRATNAPAASWEARGRVAAAVTAAYEALASPRTASASSYETTRGIQGAATSGMAWVSRVAAAAIAAWEALLNPSIVTAPPKSPTYFKPTKNNTRFLATKAATYFSPTSDT